jgi:hypothetical protein
MKHEIALQIAASTVDELSVSEAERLVSTYLSHLARCPACDSEPFKVGRDIEIPVPYEQRPARIERGTEIPCPRCGGEGTDPDVVAWHCLSTGYGQHCRNEAERDQYGMAHVNCGQRLVLPIPQDQPD